MMRGLLLGLAAVSLLRGQTTRYIRCATMEVDSAMRALHPDWPRMDEYEPLMKRKVSEKKALYEQARTIGGVYRIPVVVHVIHGAGEAVGTGRNIPTANILHQIEVLNEDFRRMPGTPGWNNDPRGADTRIEFVLAKRDPSGNPTNGIVRIDGNARGWGNPPYNNNTLENTIKPATIWDPNRYLNIWVTEINGGILGYAQFPDLSGLLGMPGDGASNPRPCQQSANTDGVVILHTAFGSIPKGSTGIDPVINMGRTTTHEIGHFLGLRHTWGDGGCDVDDFCDDTPLCSGSLYGCVANPTSCVPGVRRMIENYMDYSDDPCMNIFTLEQALRMRIVLENCPRRRTLITSPALVPPHPVDAALVDLAVPQDMCPGTYSIAATIRNNGTSATNNLTSASIAYRVGTGSWQNLSWTGNLAAGASASVNLTNINFGAGEHEFTACIASDANSNPDPSQDTIRMRVFVHNGFYPLYETFEHEWEGQPILPRLWRVVNPDNDCYTWRPGACIGSNGQPTIAMYVNCYYYQETGRRDELYSPIIDLTNVSAPVQLSFDVAYRRYDNNSNEGLRVEVATGCGTNWQATPIFQQTGAALATGPNLGARFIPTQASEWQTRTVDLGPYINQRIRLRFVTINDYGNNIWIDNVRIAGAPIVFWRDTGQVVREELTWPALAGDCRRYRDIQIPVGISSAPSANVTVSVSAAASSTARSGVDFSIQTPTLTFPSGSANPRNAVVRIFDDQAIENPRYVDLELSVTSGPATALQQYRRIHRLWIEDNDFFPPEVVLYKEDFESASHGFTQVTVTSGANSWVRGTGANMGSGHSYYITNNPSGTPPPHAYTVSSISRVAAVSPSINTTNATDLVLAFDVLVGGEYNDNNGNLIDYGRLFYSTTSATTGFQPLIGCAWNITACPMHTVARSHSLYGYPAQVRRIVIPLPPATWNRPNLWLAWRWDNNGAGGTQPPLAIDNIVLYGRKTPAIESATAFDSVYLGPGDSLYAYSRADGELIACLVNLGTSDHGCTRIEIDRTGNSAQALRPGHTAAEYVTDKTFRVRPTSGTAASYAITLYYSNAEVSGYESATGGTWNATPYVVRTAGSVADEYNAPAPTFQVSASRAVGNYGSAGRWIRGTFSNFSGFAAGNPSVSTSLVSSERGGFWIASPVRGEIVLGTAAPFHKLRILSLEGKLLWESEGAFSEGVHRLSAPTLSAGMYVAQAVEKGGSVLFQQKVLWAP